MSDLADPFDIPLAELRHRRSAKWTRIPEGALPLWVAEMDVRLAGPIRERLADALAIDDTGYAGDPSAYKEALAGFAERTWGWRPDPAGMTLYPDLAASGAVALAQLAGDDSRAVICPPVYNAFYRWLEDAGVRGVEVPLHTGGADPGSPDLDGIERALADGVRVVLISSPHNPLGRLWRREELERLAVIADRHGATVIADEIHAPLAHPGHEFVPYLSLGPAARRSGVALHSASKAWNLAGLKASALIRAEEGPRLEHTPEVEFSIGLMGLLAGEVAFSPESGPWLDDVRERLAARAAHVIARLGAELPAAHVAAPEAGYLLWVDLREAMPGDDEPAATILERTGLFVSAGHHFGDAGRGFVRLNVGTSMEIVDDAIDRLVRAAREAQEVQESREA